MPLAGRLMNWQQQGTGAVADVQLAGESRPRALRLCVPGHHMALNALGALLAAVEVGSVDAVLDGLAGFEGVRRRFELVGTANGIRVFDDYAHHPTEVRAALSALRTVAQQSGGGRTLAVFQPHLYSRTRFSLKSGLHSTAPIASSCSTSTPPGSSRWPASAAPRSPSTSRCRSTTCRTSPRWRRGVTEVTGPVTWIVTPMGAGDVTMLGPEILTALQVAANRNAPGTRG